MPYSDARYRDDQFDDMDLSDTSDSDSEFDDFDDVSPSSPYQHSVNAGLKMPSRPILDEDDDFPGPAKPIKERKFHIYLLTFLAFVLVLTSAGFTAHFDNGFVPKDILSWKVGGASIADLFKIGSAEELIEHTPPKENKNDEPEYTENTMPDSVKYADFDIFEGNTYCSVNGYKGTELTVVLPATYNGKPCTRIEANAFTDSPVTSIEIPDSYTYIGQNAFSGCSITDLYLPDSVTEIGWGMCSGNKNLRSVRFSASLEKIAEWSFASCISLTDLEIPGTVKTIGQWAFTDCVSITDLKLNEGIETLESCAFYGCSDLKTLIVPQSVTSIGEMCFRSCTSLMIVSIPETMESVGKNAFMNCSKVLTFFGEVGGRWESYAKKNNFFFDSINNLDLSEDDDTTETSSTDISASDVSSSDTQ